MMVVPKGSIDGLGVWKPMGCYLKITGRCSHLGHMSHRDRNLLTQRPPAAQLQEPVNPSKMWKVKELWAWISNKLAIRGTDLTNV